MKIKHLVGSLVAGALLAVTLLLAACGTYGNGLRPQHPPQPGPMMEPTGIFDNGDQEFPWYDTDGDGEPDWVHDGENWVPVTLRPVDQAAPGNDVWVNWFWYQGLPWIFEIFEIEAPELPGLPVEEIDDQTAEELLETYGVPLDGDERIQAGSLLPSENPGELLTMLASNPEALFEAATVMIVRHGTHRLAWVDPMIYGFAPGSFGFDRVDPATPEGHAYSRAWIVGSGTEIGDFMYDAGFDSMEFPVAPGVVLAWERSGLDPSATPGGRRWTVDLRLR